MLPTKYIKLIQLRLQLSKSYKRLIYSLVGIFIKCLLLRIFLKSDSEFFYDLFNSSLYYLSSSKTCNNRDYFIQCLNSGLSCIHTEKGNNKEYLTKSVKYGAITHWH